MPLKPRILSVGAPIWFFDVNRRVYRDRKVDPCGGPIWRKHWVKMLVTAETPRKWIIGLVLGDTKGHHQLVKTAVPGKEYLRSCGFAVDEAHIDELQWIEDHRNNLIDAIRVCNDADRLRVVAAALGWSPLP